MAMLAPPDVKDKSASAPPSPNLHSLHPQPHHPHAHPRPVPPQPYYLDERDGFISWLRGEFVAANAIIDSLSNHLCTIGDPGEYDAVLASINQRRCNWTTILYMQQYFPISDVVYAIKQVTWRRQQQQQAHTSNNSSRKEYRKGNFNPNHYHNNNHSSYHNHSSNISGNNLGLGKVKEGVSPRSAEKGGEVSDKDEDTKGFDGDGVGEEEEGVVSKALGDPTSKNVEVVGENAYDGAKSESDKSEGCASMPNEQNQKLKQSISGVPKTFVANELIDGRMVNTVDGLKLYDLLDDTEVRKLLSLANDLKVAGKRGQFQGQTYVVSKRPMRGHGREMIQLGIPVTDSPAEVENVEIHKDRKIESIPTLLQDIIDRLMRMQIVTVKPDSCTIDFYYEGDHSRPHSWPHWYGRPVCMLSLTEFDMNFGKTFTINHPGDFRGALKLSLMPGSLLVMQGKAADLAKHAIPPMRKQRMLVTFTKCQPKKLIPFDARVPSPTVVQPPTWGPRSPTPHPLNHVPHRAGALPAPPIHPQISAPNGVPTLFVAAPVVPALPFPAPVAITAPPTVWSAVPPRHPPPPHLAAPGTGVFLPPQGSGNPSSSEQSSGEQNCSTSVSPNGKQADLRKGWPEANGSINGLKDSKNDEKHNGEYAHTAAHTAAGKQNGTV